MPAKNKSNLSGTANEAILRTIYQHQENLKTQARRQKALYRHIDPRKIKQTLNEIV